MPLVFRTPFREIFWVVVVMAWLPDAALVLGRRRQHASLPSRDSGSLALTFGALFLASALVFPLARVPRFQFAAQWASACFWGGIALMLAGAGLRWLCRRVLGRHFTAIVQVAAEQPVIEDGPYAYVRHPAYLGSLLSIVGLGLALGSWGSVLLIGLTATLVVRYRIAVEERVLVSQLGEPYRRYMARHKRLLPFIY